MANTDDYLTTYREFFEHFAETVNPNDQLPVKLASYKLINVEVVGAIIDWTTQYLSQKQCPPHLYSPLIKIIIEEIRKACKKHPLNYGFSTSDNAYEPLKLMQAVMAKTNEVCLRYTDNSMLCSLPGPTNTYFETSICAARNKRRTMEDRHVAIHDLNTMFNIQEASPSSYYAVFDGHAGHDAAAYSAAHLHQYLAENKHFISNPEQALIDAFCKTDALFLEKCRVESLSSGTTAVAALLRPKEKVLYIAWVGDSQAILVNQGRVMQCVNPHKPCREDERIRIDEAGGCVMMLWGTWRVNGQLAVSRAIGDADYKPHVIAIPDVREIPLDGGEDFLVLACDGIWDVLSEDAVAQEVYYLIKEKPDDTERISKHLVQFACCQNSTDNISVIVVFLRDPHKIASEAHRWAAANEEAQPQTQATTPTADQMDTELENANNGPFANTNGTGAHFAKLEADNIHIQKGGEGLLLNLTDNFKQQGANLTDDFFLTEKSNGTKRSTPDLHSDDDFGPETAVDDPFTPTEKSHHDAFEKPFKTFSDEVKAFADGLANNNPLQGDFHQFLRETSEENEKESDAIDDEGDDRVEEERGPPVGAGHDASGLEENPADSDSEDEWNYIKGDQANKENIAPQPDSVVEDSDDAMSQLNPNAAEFVPVSPTRSVASPTCRALINDEVLAQSPKRPQAVDINVPNEIDFEKEIKSRPSDVANGNGHAHDEIANFGDDTEQTLNESEFSIVNKEQDDPMSMSFYAEKGESNPFDDDLNKVHQLPDDLDEFLKRGESKTEKLLDDTISDLPEHYPLGGGAQTHDNDQAAIQTTDLDKLSQDDEKELASPLEPDQEPIETAKTPVTDNLLEDFVAVQEKTDLAEQVSEISELSEVEQSKSTAPEDLSEPIQSPVEEQRQNFTKSPELGHEVELLRPSAPYLEENADLLEPEVQKPALEVEDLLKPAEPVDLLESKSPFHLEAEPSNFGNVEEPVPFERASPVCEFRQEESKSPFDAFDDLNVCSKAPPSDTHETEFNPKSEFEQINVEHPIPDVPITEHAPFAAPACEYSADPACELQQPEHALNLQEEEITSSIKDDDISSPIESPIKSPEPLVEEQQVVQLEEKVTESKELNLPSTGIESFSFDTTPEVPVSEKETVLSPQTEEPAIPSFQQPSFVPQPFASQQFYGFESAAPVEDSRPFESQQFHGFESAAPQEDTRPFSLSNGFDNLNSEISIKTEHIQPEFAEQTVITPSEESKILDDVPTVPLIETPVEEPKPVPVSEPAPVIEEPVQALQTTEVSQEAPKEVPLLAPLPVSPVVTQEPTEVKKDEKKPTPASSKKPIGKVAPSKSATATSKVGAAASKTTAKPLGTAPRTGLASKAPSKTGTATKPAPIAATRPSPKPKTATTTAPKTLERKPLTNGDVKPAPKTLTRKPATEALATKTTARPATASARTNLTKTTTPPRPATAPRAAVPKASSTTVSKTTTSTLTAKPRTTNLTSRTLSSAVSKTTTTTTSRAAPATLSPKTATAPKPRTITSAPPKPRVPLSKTITKSADVEKQNKESANKITASRTTTTTKTTSSSLASRTTTTAKKTETKPLTRRPIPPKTTTSTTKTTSPRKPGDVKPPAATKTKTTKVEKPKENGIAPTSVTTEEIKEITVVSNNVTAESEDLLKDNSPLDNKLLTGASNPFIEATPAD
ncbi:SH3 domain-containing protein C23A1.17-like isoform X2 [Sitophilus oryzae]|uniref:SH3 domain-containing protein C23A1.17-like isoform X2 n=1 Tax=Sitophilus oryzae TaxID=7048 RepID=A0A6J2YLB0_SITOR|nr:SH3 domain-containing protein C23A1.17-like isoform X2 [Sitophilus oryzae]